MASFKCSKCQKEITVTSGDIVVCPHCHALENVPESLRGGKSGAPAPTPTPAPSKPVDDDLARALASALSGRTSSESGSTTTTPASTPAPTPPPAPAPAPTPAPTPAPAPSRPATPPPAPKPSTPAPDPAAEAEKKNKAAYNSAASAMKKAKTEADFLAAAAMFAKLGTYKDSAEQAQACRDKAAEVKNEEIYKKANSLLASKTSSNISKAIGLLESIEGYKNADELLRSCRIEYERVLKEEEEAARQSKYEEACGMARSRDIETVKKAKEIFESMLDYEDSEDKLDECDHRIHYLKVVAMREIEDAKDKKRRKAKIIISIIAAILAIIIIPMVFDGLDIDFGAIIGGNTPEGEVRFEYDDRSEGLYITGVKNDDIKDLTIPAFINDNKVYGIDDYAFKDSNIQSLTIEFGVSRIGMNAFANCGNLNSVSIPESVTEIGFAAFENCSNLLELTIPFVGTNGYGHFGEIFGTSSIEEHAYAVPYSLDKVRLTGGSLKTNDFANCDGLINVIIDRDVDMDQSRGAFVGCYSIETFEFPATHYAEKFGEFFYDNNAYYPSNGGEIEYNANVPSSLKYVIVNAGAIQEYYFKNCPDIEEIEATDNVVAIAKGAFYGCNSLHSLSIPFIVNSSVDDYSFLGYMFGDNAPTENTYVPNSLKIVNITNASELGRNSFFGCAYINQISISNKTTYIDGGAFYGADSLVTLEIPFTGDGNSDSHLSYSFTPWGQSISVDYIPESLVEVKLNSGNSVASDAFRDCLHIQTIVLPDGITSISTGAFAWCESLSSINFPESLEDIGAVAFWGCSALEKLDLPANINSIGESAFADCFNISEIYLPEYLSYVGMGAFRNCTSLSGVEMYGNITEIASEAFYGCENLYRILFNGKGYQWNEIAFGSDWNSGCPNIGVECEDTSFSA